MKRTLIATLALALSAGLALGQTTPQYYQFPANSVPVLATSGTVAAAAATATMPATSGWKNYVQGVRCSGGGATAASIVTLTLSGTFNNIVQTVAVPAGVTAAIVPVEFNFVPALPASDSNTAIVVSMPSLGAGNTVASCHIWGFRITG